MGGITSVPARVFRNWNVENRALRSIDKARPATPRYPTEQRISEQRSRTAAAKEEGSGSLTPGCETEKNPQLDNWLKQVKVFSQDIPLHQQAIEHDPRKATSERTLPQERTSVGETEFGYHEPGKGKVLPGKITVRQALEIISFYQQDPDTYTSKYFSQAFNCKEQDIEDMFQYFKLFLLYVPKTKKGTEEKTLSYSKAIFSSNDATIKLLNNPKPSFLKASQQSAMALKIRRSQEAEMDKEDAEAGVTEARGAKKYQEIAKDQYDRADKKTRDSFPYRYGIVQEDVMKDVKDGDVKKE